MWSREKTVTDVTRITTLFHAINIFIYLWTLIIIQFQLWNLLLHSLLWVTIFHILNGYVGDAANGTTIMGESNVNVVGLKLLTYVDCGGKVDSVIEVLVKQFCLANKKGIWGAFHLCQQHFSALFLIHIACLLTEVHCSRRYAGN